MSEIITYANYYMKQDFAFVVKLQKRKMMCSGMNRRLYEKKIEIIFEIHYSQILILTKEGENT